MESDHVTQRSTTTHPYEPSPVWMDSSACPARIPPDTTGGSTGMHLDLRDGDPPERLETGICVIGAGAAGIIAARRLLAAGCEVLLLERGGLDHEPEIAALNAGASIGENYYDLEHARLSFFGGTTAIWGGRCAELDAIDLRRRAWVAHSGWPIEHADLAPYYREARALFGLGPSPVRPADLREAGVPIPSFDPERLVTTTWSFDDRSDRFAFGGCGDLVRHPRCTVVTHASVSELIPDVGGRALACLTAASLSGHRLQVRARHYLLAAGGIENARLLLASRSVIPAGIGNAHDQVGRYFMEHPHSRGGQIVDGPAWTLLRIFAAKHRVRGERVGLLLAAAPALQERLGLLNTSLAIAARRPAGDTEGWGKRLYLRARHGVAPTRIGRRLWQATKGASRGLQRWLDPARPWLFHKLGRLELALVVRAEQSPHPDSRVLLDRERDALGVPRIRLDWRTSPRDAESVAGLVQTLGEETERLGLGRTQMAPWLREPWQGWRTDPLISAHPIGGYHHMGTTRMAVDPRHGVTDGEGRVHGMANLFVAGSSLFPTSGWANPTLTIAALALRTADRIVASGSVSYSTARPELAPLESALPAAARR